MSVAAPRTSLLRESATALARAIREQRVSSVDVVGAHVERLRAVTPRLNAVVCDRYDAALADAADADRRVATTPPGERDGLPPLLGVPCTIKESIQYAGMPNCAGAVHRREFRSPSSAPAVARLLAAGAIPLGVTNTSEATMWIETDNRVYGRTNNAYDPRRTAGGSSGGEGAAVGSGGVPFGLGSDIGGSVRLPAFFNGAYGHKASQGVVPNTGQWPEDDGDVARMLSIGPLTRAAEDLMPLLRIIAGPDGADRHARAVTLADPADVDVAALDVVVASHASYVPASREIRGACEAAVDALRGRGASVRVEPLKELRRALEIYFAVLSTGANTVVGAMFAAEGASPATLRDVWRARRTDHTFPTVLLMAGDAISRRMPEKRTRRLAAAADILRREVEAVIGDGVLICPPHPRVAPRHGRTVGRPWVLTPTAAFNLLGLPATVIPRGLTAAGVPTGVQAVAGRDRDHVSIAVAQAIGQRVPPPGA